MAHRFISDLRAGERIDHQVFLIRSKDLRNTTQGSLYIHAVLADRSGQLVARMWQASEEIFNYLPEGGFVALKGRVEAYKGNPQFIIEAVRPADPETYDVADFVASTKQDIDQMWQSAEAIIRSVKHPDLKLLMDEFLADEELMTAFRKAPAAAVMHHAYVGGLLEHTLSLMQIAEKVIPMYPKLSLDLVLCGLFLHDIGKSKELEYEAAISYSDEGQLLGHITQAVMMIEAKANQVAEKTGQPFPKELRWVLQHIILSHHGRYEFGSPKLPAIPEAVAIHYLDNLDAKVNMYLAEIENDRDPAGRWTNYNRALESKIYKVDPTGTRTQPTEEAKQS